MIFPALAVLISFALITCDGFGGPDGEQIEYTEDGRPLIELTINPAGGRALTANITKGSADYYEVAFFDGTNYYRTSWFYSQIGKIKIPPGDYAGAGKAVLFAGNSADFTLLAVGIISKVDDVTATGNNILATTKSVTFQLVPFTTNVHDKVLQDPGTATADPVKKETSTTFIITAPTGTSGYATEVKYALNAANGDNPLPTAKFEGQNIPVYLVPKSDTTIKASFLIGLNGEYTDNTAGSPTNFATYAPGIKVKEIWDGKVKSVGLLIAGAGTGEDKPVAVDAEITLPLQNTNFPANGTVTMDITTGAIDGLARLSIEIPVCAINNTASNPITWYIRGGLSNHLPDAGATVYSTGGAVVLGVGDTSYNWPSIIINGDWDPPSP